MRHFRLHQTEEAFPAPPSSKVSLPRAAAPKAARRFPLGAPWQLALWERREARCPKDLKPNYYVLSFFVLFHIHEEKCVDGGIQNGAPHSH